MRYPHTRTVAFNNAMSGSRQIQRVKILEQLQQQGIIILHLGVMAARIIARMLVLTVGPVMRAFAQAYRQAAGAVTHVACGGVIIGMQ